MNLNRMWLKVVWSICLVAVIGFCDILNAQDRGWGVRNSLFGRSSGFLSLLDYEEVQKDVGVRKDQKEKIRQLQQEVREHHLDLNLDMSDEERRAASEKSFKAQRKFYEELPKILDEKQIERLKEIQRQARGVMCVMTDRQVAQVVKLTKSQNEEAQQVIEDTRKQVGDLLSDLSDPETMDKIRELHNKSSEKVFELLDNKQKKAFKRALGKPFDFSSLLTTLPCVVGR